MNYALDTNTFGAGDKRIRAKDQHPGAGDEHSEKMCLNFSHTHKFVWMPEHNT